MKEGNYYMVCFSLKTITLNKIFKKDYKGLKHKTKSVLKIFLK